MPKGCNQSHLYLSQTLISQPRKPVRYKFPAAEILFASKADTARDQNKSLMTLLSSDVLKKQVAHVLYWFPGDAMNLASSVTQSLAPLGICVLTRYTTVHRSFHLSESVSSGKKWSQYSFFRHKTWQYISQKSRSHSCFLFLTPMPNLSLNSVNFRSSISLNSPSLCFYQLCWFRQHEFLTRGMLYFPSQALCS